MSTIEETEDEKEMSFNTQKNRETSYIKRIGVLMPLKCFTLILQHFENGMHHGMARTIKFFFDGKSAKDTPNKTLEMICFLHLEPRMKYWVKAAG